MAEVLAPLSNNSGRVSDQADKAEADRLLAEGKRVYLDDPDCAVEHLGRAMRIYESLGLSNDPVAAPLFLAYGLALVETARSSSDVFGEKVEGMDGGAKEELLGGGATQKKSSGQENQDPEERTQAKGGHAAMCVHGHGHAAC